MSTLHQLFSEPINSIIPKLEYYNPQWKKQEIILAHIDLLNDKQELSIQDSQMVNNPVFQEFALMSDGALNNLLSEHGFQMDSCGGLDTILILMSVYDNSHIWHYIGKYSADSLIIELIRQPMIISDIFQQLVTGIEEALRYKLLDTILKIGEEYGFTYDYKEESEMSDDAATRMILESDIKNLEVLYETSKQCKRLLNSEDILRQLSEKFEVPQTITYANLIIELDKSFYTPRCEEYHDLNFCFIGAIEHGDEPMFSKLIQKIDSEKARNYIEIALKYNNNYMAIALFYLHVDSELFINSAALFLECKINKTMLSAEYILRLNKKARPAKEMHGDYFTNLFQVAAVNNNVTFLEHLMKYDYLTSIYSRRNNCKYVSDNLSAIFMNSLEAKAYQVVEWILKTFKVFDNRGLFLQKINNCNDQVAMEIYKNS